MFQLDDNFLADIGIGDLPKEQKDALLKHIYEELELRVGTLLAEGLSESQMKEFEKILDRDDEFISSWLMTYVPGYEDTADYQQYMSTPSGAAGLADYTATKWLEVNRPNYRDVVAQTLEGLKQELIDNKDSILANS